MSDTRRITSARLVSTGVLRGSKIMLPDGTEFDQFSDVTVEIHPHEANRMEVTLALAEIKVDGEVAFDGLDKVPTDILRDEIDRREE